MDKDRATTVVLPVVTEFFSPKGCFVDWPLAGLVVSGVDAAGAVVMGEAAPGSDDGSPWTVVLTAGVAVVEGAGGGAAEDVFTLGGALLLLGVVTAFAYWASETVEELAASGAEVAPEGPLVGARDDVDFSCLIDLATVICTWDSAALTPTRATDAAPIAAIDSATASQPTASPAT